MLGLPEDTMFQDRNGNPIMTGDVVRAPCINGDFHGSWVEYRVTKRPGGYILSYLRSEKGKVLPEGYTGGYMADVLPDEDEKDTKSLIFALVPIKVKGWEIQTSEEGA